MFGGVGPNKGGKNLYCHNPKGMDEQTFRFFFSRYLCIIWIIWSIWTCSSSSINLYFQYLHQGIVNISYHYISLLDLHISVVSCPFCHVTAWRPRCFQHPPVTWWGKACSFHPSFLSQHLGLFLVGRNRKDQHVLPPQNLLHNLPRIQGKLVNFQNTSLNFLDLWIVDKIHSELQYEQSRQIKSFGIWDFEKWYTVYKWYLQLLSGRYYFFGDHIHP